MAKAFVESHRPPQQMANPAQITPLAAEIYVSFSSYNVKPEHNFTD